MLAELGNSLRGKIKFNGRLFDTPDDGAFGKSSLNQLDDRIVGERRDPFQFGDRTRLAGRAQNPDSGAAGGHGFPGSGAVGAAALGAAVHTAARPEDVGRITGVRLAGSRVPSASR